MENNCYKDVGLKVIYIIIFLINVDKDIFMFESQNIYRLEQ